jgi:hypothetical protein
MALVAFAAFVMGAVPAKSALVYDYTGNSFAVIQNPALGTSLSATVTFNNVVTNNYTGNAYTSDIESVTFFTKNSTFYFTTNSPTEGFFTFSNGKITSWYLVGYGANGSVEAATICCNGADLGGGLQTADDVISTQENYTYSYSSSPQGTWVLATPLPGGLSLFGSALAGFVVLASARRRQRVSA